MNSDPHGPYVKALAEAGDWAALVRYSIAHEHKPTLEQAISLVRRRVQGGESHWQPVIDYLEAVKAKPSDPPDQVPETLLPHLKEAERHTLLLLHLYPRAALCKEALQTPPEDQAQRLQIGVESAEEAAQAGLAIGDPAVRAFFRGLLARGLYKIGQMEAARQAWGDTLRLYRELAQQRPEVYRPDVATTLNSLGNAQSDLNDFGAARACYEEALVIQRELAQQRPEVYRPDVAGTLNNLGIVQRRLSNLEAARASYEEALVSWRELARQRPDVYRPDVAMTLHNLGGVQSDLNDLEAARATYEEALVIRRELARLRPEVYRPDVATTLNSLGNAQSDLNDFGAARACYEEALVIQRELAQQRPEVYRPNVAMTLHNLGGVQHDLNELERARTSLKDALAIRRELARQWPEVYRPKVAMTLNSLATVQSDLNDLEAARASCEEALATYRELARQWPEVYRPDVAMTLHNLGNLLSNLNDLEAALVSHQEALVIRRELAQQRPEVYRPNVAMTLNSLATVQSDLNDLEAARASCEEALAILRELTQQRPEVYLPKAAMTLNNLGIVQHTLNDPEAARASCEEALAILRELAQQRPEVYRPKVAMTLNNLGTVQEDLDELGAARASYDEAARLHEEDAHQHSDAWLVERKRAHTNFARLVRREDVRLGWPDYRAARRHLELACHCAEQFREKSRDEGGRRRVQTESSRLFELHVRNCVDVWDVSVQEGRPDVGALRQAVWAAEASRSRQLLDMVAQEELRPVLAPPGLQAEYAHLREQLDRTRLRLQREEEHRGKPELTGSDTGRRGLDFGDSTPQAVVVRAGRSDGSAREELLKLLRQQKKDMEAVLEQIRLYDPEFDPNQGGQAVACEAIEALIPPEPRTAFVQYALGEEKSLAFVLLGQDTGEIRPVPLPGLRVEEMERLGAKWFEAYSRWRDKPLSPEEQVREWETHMRPVLEEVRTAALEPVLSALPEGLEQLVISPHQSLHVFPLHACPVGGGRLLGDQYEVVYTPSFTMLHRCAQRRPDGGVASLLVECPEGVLERYLPFARAECAALGRRLGRVRRISGDEATAEVVAEAGRECGLLHYCGHVVFNAQEVWKSKLMLTGEPLMLVQVFYGMRLPRNRLVVLSGCESGLLVPDVLDDYLSFTTGFLYAGAPCVVSALWTIPDLPSALLMDRFYELWLAGQTPAAALRAAQGWLRALRAGPELDGAVWTFTEHLEDPTEARQCREASARYVAGLGERPFASPVHWAAFTCSGVGYSLSSTGPLTGIPQER